MRVLLILSYNGSKFLGFQQQLHTKNSVMNYLIDALSSLGIKNIPIGSGRTDKSVHANNQTLHLDLPHFWSDIFSLKTHLNRHLHPYIHIKKIYPVKDEFHARYSAVAREYRYIFSHENFSPFLNDFCSFYPPFDMEKLNNILHIFKGRHDFEYFKKNGSDTKNFTREIYHIKAKKYKDKTIISIKADGFLRSQIRMIISATLKVYESRLTKENIINQLNKKEIFSRSLAPANGLYLHRIYYHKDIFI